MQNFCEAAVDQRAQRRVLPIQPVQKTLEMTDRDLVRYAEVSKFSYLSRNDYLNKFKMVQKPICRGRIFLLVCGCKIAIIIPFSSKAMTSWSLLDKFYKINNEHHEGGLDRASRWICSTYGVWCSIGSLNIIIGI